QRQERKRMRLTIAVRACARQIVDGLCAVAHHHQWIHEPGHPASAFHQKSVVFVVFRVEDGRRPTHGGGSGAAFNSNQNVLPFPKVDSTPTLPPMRSIPFLTIERPIPVPS